MDHQRFQKNVRKLYEVVQDLTEMFPGRPFTPDGHMVGSLGECLVADAYDLKLMEPSNEGFDAVGPSGKQIEIKATQGSVVAFRSCPEHSIVIRITRDGGFDECYNGPGKLIWAEFESRKRPSNGQYQISLKRLAQLNAGVPGGQRIQKIV